MSYWPVALAAALLAGAFLLRARYRAAMKSAHARLAGCSHVVGSPYGAIEYAEGGRGPEVLVVHGSGGGHDQGALVAEAILGRDFHWIAPSRFGYLRSTLPPGATFDTQAHAYASLLDHLGVGRVAVVALSHGGPSALLFALLHPERVSSLALVSCGVARAATPGQTSANRSGALLLRAVQTDFGYWLLSNAFRRPLLRLMGASRPVVASLTPGQRAWVRRFVDAMNPASLRHAGAAFDHRAELPGARIAAIQAPTLVLHADDDLLQLPHNAAFAASTIPGARLRRFARGGHLLAVVEQAAVRAAVTRHVLEHATGLERSAATA